MAQLAIKGHPTRGKEVIEILEMLGGENIHNYDGTFNECYIIDNNKICTIYTSVAKIDNYIIFTLEEFLEKYPYKVGDKVIVKGLSEYPKSINFMKWFDYNIHYSFDNETWFLPSALNLYKEETMDKAVFDTNAQCCDIMNRLIKKETMEKQKKDYEEWFQINYLEFENNDDTWADEVEVNLGKDYEIQIRGDKTFIVKKQPQLPKTYEECCTIMGFNSNTLKWNNFFNINKDTHPYIKHFDNLIENFCKLLICRDAYWKIAGEQMGLGRSWVPDWDNLSTAHEFITINKGCFIYSSRVLVFPTVEMRDMFYENFKELIEMCKELL